jgi:rhamnogalacturonyl hydrolase YesR
MKKYYLFNIPSTRAVILLLLVVLGCTEEPTQERVNPFNVEDIQNLVVKVADWQLENPNPRIDSFDEIWERSVFYLGVMAAYRVSGKPKFLQATKEWAKSQAYQIGSEERYFHADDEVIGQVYLELFRETADSVYIENVISRSYKVVNLDKRGRDLWNWCDALFMTPPLISSIAELQNDQEKLEKLDQKWWDVYDFLYEPDYNLFYRDARYIDTLNINGNKIFWSRGNGWVLAGLARMLQHWNPSDPAKNKYEDLFRSMSVAIAALQSENGLWRTNLVDRLEFPEPETSGTAFFIYAMAWGVNRGLLDEDQFLATIRNGWVGLVESVSGEGILERVQQPYHEPGIVYPNGHQEYATGAFLMAAKEVRRLLQNEKL